MDSGHIWSRRAASLEPSAHDLNAVAPFVAPLVVFDGRLALLLTGDAGTYPFDFQRFYEQIRVVASVAEQPFDVWQAAQQRPSSGVIADLSRGDEEADSVRSYMVDVRDMEIGRSLDGIV